METSDKKLLILDVDETLIHARTSPLDRAPDFTVFDYHVYKRPFLDQFLQEIQADFKIAFWSSASDDYVEKIVDTIYPGSNPREFAWGRTRCTPKPVMETDSEYGIRAMSGLAHYNYIKRLEKIRRYGYRLETTLIVDDTPHKINNSYGNAIYIKEFEGDPGDRELEKLLKFLQSIRHVPNVRAIEKRGWQNDF